MKSDTTNMKTFRKRVDIVSIKLVRHSSVLYSPRKISSPRDAVSLIKEFLDELDREEFLVITLDSKHQPTSINICAIGTINNCLVHPREVFKTAILSNSSSIMVAHNHPSGFSEPSHEDRQITKRLEDAGDILGIKLLDHIVVAGDEYFSFQEQGFI